MKINDIQRLGAVNPYKKLSDAKLSHSEGKKQSKKDEVNFSSEAKELLSAQGTNRKIDDLKQSYAAGSYYVETGKLAEKLLPYI